MSVLGLAVSPSRCFCIPGTGCNPKVIHAKAPSFQRVARLKERGKLQLAGRSKCNGSILPRQAHIVRCAMDASFSDGSTIFPRIDVSDPYKRLGISREASEDEIQAARNFLVQKYAGHKASVDAIEFAHDKIIMQKFYEMRNPKIDVKKKVRAVTQSRVVQAVFSRFQTPSTKFIIKAAVAFLVLAVLTVLFPTEEGPTLQVVLSLIATMYFIHDRLKRKWRAFLYGFGAFIFSWLLGTFLMVSAIPPLFKGLRGFEVTTSLITYVPLDFFNLCEVVSDICGRESVERDGIFRGAASFHLSVSCR